MDFALHQAVALEAAQSLREHLLRNPADRALQLCVTNCAPRQDLNNERCPFVGNPVEHESRRALWFQD